ncbi:peptidase S24/S26A/S26B [Natronococcus amylolyticus DSM 10524]|uniref:Peptidase S24/S26A/S26B n=1 Tax=Natronococcus amylolyticus DSM 10524 TaxID=1227497 RepID=L9XCT9_9EURY|nr:S26 family signal peptidase [Natronococcus amylolyticus]ELY59545.1 peptidase S24/S26A/S26B [Natronococcus amylolyticus DSM 10524]
MSGPDSGDERSDDSGEPRRHDPSEAPLDGTDEPARGSRSANDGRPRNGVGTEDEESVVQRSGSGSESDDVSIEDDGIVRWFFGTNDESVVLVRDILSSVAIVAVIGLLLFGISGVWPPLVAVESGSMEPNMEVGDLIFVVADDRFVGDDSTGDTGVVTHEDGEDHEKFGKAGDVVVFEPNGQAHQTPVIHRAHFWVEEGENWVDTRAEPEYVDGASCDQLQTCPAAHDGFITKGDANPYYDQYQRGGANTDVVQPGWITGKASFRVPWLGYVRLTFDSILGGMLAPQPGLETVADTVGTETPVSSAGAVGASVGAAGVAAAGTGAAMAAGRRRRR